MWYHLATLSPCVCKLSSQCGHPASEVQSQAHWTSTLTEKSRRSFHERAPALQAGQLKRVIRRCGAVSDRVLSVRCCRAEGWAATRQGRRCCARLAATAWTTAAARSGRLCGRSVRWMYTARRCLPATGRATMCWSACLPACASPRPPSTPSRPPSPPPSRCTFPTFLDFIPPIPLFRPPHFVSASSPVLYSGSSLHLGSHSCVCASLHPCNPCHHEGAPDLRLHFCGLACSMEI